MSKVPKKTTLSQLDLELLSKLTSQRKIGTLM